MFIEDYIKKSIETKEKILSDKNIIISIQSAANTIIKAYKEGNKVLTAGNGGSSADAQHIAGELISKFALNRKPLPSIALPANTIVLTAIGNDLGYDKVFSRQIQGMAVKGDILIAISTSGTSKNIIEALKEAKNKGLITIGLTGKNKSEADSYCDIIIKAPSDVTSIIQEAHIVIEHIICALVEKEIFGDKNDN